MHKDDIFKITGSHLKRSSVLAIAPHNYILVCEGLLDYCADYSSIAPMHALSEGVEYPSHSNLQERRAQD
jgi:hypothetical protein